MLESYLSDCLKEINADMQEENRALVVCIICQSGPWPLICPMFCQDFDFIFMCQALSIYLLLIKLCGNI